MISFRKIAAHFAVAIKSVQNWEAIGFNREWSFPQMEEWRAAHLANRVEDRRTRQWKDRLANPHILEDLEHEEREIAETPEELAAEVQEQAEMQSVPNFESYNEVRIAKIKKEVERLDLKIRRERGELVLISEMRETAVRIVSVWCSELDALVGDLPGQLAGLSEQEIQPKLRSRIELLKANAKEGFGML
jgi:hypothetical protein